jgi:hypothetical protein
MKKMQAYQLNIPNGRFAALVCYHIKLEAFQKTGGFIFNLTLTLSPEGEGINQNKK